MPAEDVTVNVEFITYSIVTWKYDDGSLISEEQVVTGTVPTHSAPTKDDCDFAGWTDGTGFYAVGTALPTVTGDVTYTAVFTFTDEVGARVIGHTLSRWRHRRQLLYGACRRHYRGSRRLYALHCPERRKDSCP